MFFFVDCVAYLVSFYKRLVGIDYILSTHRGVVEIFSVCLFQLVSLQTSCISACGL